MKAWQGWCVGKGLAYTIPYTSIRFDPWNFLGQTAVSRYEGLPKFRGLTLSPSSVCAGVTNPPAHPEDEDGVSSRNVENLHIMALLSTRKHFIDFCRREIFKILYMIIYFCQCGLWSNRNLKGKNTLFVVVVIMLRPLNKFLFSENRCRNLPK
jgi:hypothetical protein